MSFPGSVYHSLAIGPISGRIYLFGNRFGGVIVTTLDPANGKEMASWTGRARDGLNWLVYQGAISEDEQQLYISYHGDNTTGIDRFELSEQGLQRCTQTKRDWGCLGAHGGFSLYGKGMLVTFGYQVIVEQGLDGTIQKGFNTGLTGSHLTEFVVDPQAERLYAINSCLAPEAVRGGFSLVDLRNSAMPNLSTAPEGQEWGNNLLPPKVVILPDASKPDSSNKVPCGERLALGPKALVVVAKVIAPTYIIQPTTTGALLFIDENNGQITNNVNTLSAPLDLLAVR